MLTVAVFLLVGLLVVAACEATRGHFVRLLAGEQRVGDGFHPADRHDAS